MVLNIVNHLGAMVLKFMVVNLIMTIVCQTIFKWHEIKPSPMQILNGFDY